MNKLPIHISSETEDKHMRILTGILIIAGSLTAFVGAQFHTEKEQNIIWTFGNIMSIGGYSIIMAVLTRCSYDLVSSGFALLIAAQAFEIATTANTHHTDLAMYAAAFSLYIPGFLIVGIYSHFKWWIRLSCTLACIPFAIITFWILNDTPFSLTGTVNYAGYILRAIFDIGLGIAFLKAKKNERIYERPVHVH